MCVKRRGNTSGARVKQAVLVVEVLVDAIVGLFHTTVQLGKLTLNLSDFNMDLVMHARDTAMHSMKRSRRTGQELLDTACHRRVASNI